MHLIIVDFFPSGGTFLLTYHLIDIELLTDLGICGRVENVYAKIQLKVSKSQPKVSQKCSIKGQLISKQNCRVVTNKRHSGYYTECV